MFQDINFDNTNNFSIEIESLYIAHVFLNISKNRISSIFEKLFLAKVKGIDFVSRIGKDHQVYNSAYIHIDYWFDTSAAKHFQDRIRANSEALLIYDEPWYWIVNENTSEEKSKFIQNAENEKLKEFRLRREAMIEDFKIMKEKINLMSEEMSEEEIYQIFQSEFEESNIRLF